MEQQTFLSGTQADQPKHQEELDRRAVLLFLAQGFEDAEAACAIDMLGWTQYRPTIATIDVEIAAFHKEVTGAFGTRYTVDVAIDDVDPSAYDALIIPGGFHNRGFGEAYDLRIGELARSFVDNGKPIATMCVGILPVADAGLLEGGRATTYAFSSRHDNLGRLREAGCEAVEDEPVVEWNGIISCSGPAYSERVIYQLIELLVGKDAVDEVARFRKGHRSDEQAIE